MVSSGRGRDSETVIARVLVAVDSADDLPLVEAACKLADAVDRVPAHLPVVWRHVRGCARRRVLQNAGVDDTRVVLVGRLPWWARGALRRRISSLVLLPDVPPADRERPAALRRGAGTLA